jgi:hypothetical protein
MSRESIGSICFSFHSRTIRFKWSVTLFIVLTSFSFLFVVNLKFWNFRLICSQPIQTNQNMSRHFYQHFSILNVLDLLANRTSMINSCVKQWCCATGQIAITWAIPLVIKVRLIFILWVPRNFLFSQTKNFLVISFKKNLANCMNPLLGNDHFCGFCVGELCIELSKFEVCRYNPPFTANLCTFYYNGRYVKLTLPFWHSTSVLFVLWLTLLLNPLCYICKVILVSH